MRVLGIVLIISLASAGNLFLADFSTIGESCDKTPTFVINSFTADPWPIVKSQQYVLTIQGTFSEKEYVEQIYIATKEGISFWHYAYQTVKTEYTKGQQVVFQVPLQAPAGHGAYIVQVTLHRHDFSYLSCWQYEFSIPLV